jgi:repressor LexA
MKSMYRRSPRNTQTRELILRYILSFSNETGRQPSVREIGEAAGLMSTSTTAGYLQRMVNEGLLRQGTESKRKYYLTRVALMEMRQAG